MQNSRILHKEIVRKISRKYNLDLQIDHTGELPYQCRIKKQSQKYHRKDTISNYTGYIPYLINKPRIKT